MPYGGRAAPMIGLFTQVTRTWPDCYGQLPMAWGMQATAAGGRSAPELFVP